MRLYIYDLEVLAYDWIAIFKRPEKGAQHIVIHNDAYALKAFIQTAELIGGFNSKFYDDWVLLTMLNGGDNEKVKECNDWIIGGRNGWEFPFNQYQKKPFKSFDLRDDLDRSLSLKAIEGNLRLPIVESSVPFDIDRPLTKEELEETIKYCKHDVDSTIELYNARSEYLKSKKIVGEMYGLSPIEALGLTNAKLSARVLNAKYEPRDDERAYVLPPTFCWATFPKVVREFFETIYDESIPTDDLFKTTLDVVYKTSGGECPVTYAWGGVHGAKTGYKAKATKKRLIVNYDVASLYPNSMINFKFCSRSMEDPNAYEKLVKTRLAAKKAGDKEKAGALKLVVNTVYGAMLNEYNDLADRLAGRSVCITNQLAMTLLLQMLGVKCSTIDFININTDGIMYEIDADEDEIAAVVVKDWTNVTGFEMERDDFSKVYQKDVNNYIGIKTDGSMKTKGGYVKLYKGGDFTSNSLVIIHKAIVDYFVHGTPVEDTVNNATDIFDFQIIAKTGHTYAKTVQLVDGEEVEVQRVNRLYATSNEKYGKLIKVKADGRKDSLADCPEHAIIDNENLLTLNDIDKTYYIAMAKKRIKDYTSPKRTKKKDTEVIKIMANAKTTKTETVDAKTLNVYQKLTEARKRFAAAEIKKTGVNRYAEFKYFTLEDIVPAKNQIFDELGLVDCISFNDDRAILALYNGDNVEEKPICFTSQLAPDESLIKNPIQKVGAIQTYVRRYLYMLALDIVEADTIEAITDKPEEKKPAKSKKPASPEKREEVKKELIDEDGDATEVQIKSIKKGLKKLRDADDANEPYVKKIVKKLKTGVKKAEAEDILLEIKKKLEG